jgi:hypothetical protein
MHQVSFESTNSQIFKRVVVQQSCPLCDPGGSRRSMPRHGLGFSRSSVTFTVTFDGIDRAISTRRDMMIVVAVRSEESESEKSKMH